MPKNRKYLTRKLAKAAMILNIATNAAEHGEVYRRMGVAGYRWDAQLQMWIKKEVRRNTCELES